MRRLVQFIRDLALVPSLWCSAVVAERRRQYRASRSGMAAERSAMKASAERLRQNWAASMTSLTDEGAKP